MSTTLDENQEIRHAAPDVFFRETMSGGLCFGTSEPERGAALGLRTPFTFRATILVDDVEAFITDPEHTARLLARIDYPHFNPGLIVDRGRFNLFRPGDAPGTRLMTYALPFMNDDRSFLLSGTKVIHDEPGADLWHDTTHLFCQLHEGEDPRAPVVGAGMLSLGLTDVIKLVATMGSCRPGRAGLEARLRFGEFFLGSLWELYAPKLRDLEGMEVSA